MNNSSSQNSKGTVLSIQHIKLARLFSVLTFFCTFLRAYLRYIKSRSVLITGLYEKKLMKQHKKRQVFFNLFTLHLHYFMLQTKNMIQNKKEMWSSEQKKCKYSLLFWFSLLVLQDQIDHNR